MFTTFNAIFTLCLAMLATVLVSAAPALVEREVWDPEILTPNAFTVWYTGQKYNVTWCVTPATVDRGGSLMLPRNTDDAPVNITNKIGRVVLGKGGIQNQGEWLARPSRW